MAAIVVPCSVFLITEKFTAWEIAEAIATTRVTVTRLLQQFKSEGRLLQHKRQFILCGNM